MKQLTKTNQKERKNKGITLIALVITIIVLLILAAVSISTLTGDNGILTKANEAKEMTEIAKIKEEVQTEILAVQAENDGKITTTQLKIILDKYFSNVPNDDQLNEEIELITTEGNYKIKLSDIFKGSLSEGNGNTEDLAINRLKINSSAPTEAERSPYVNYNGRACRVLYDNTSPYGLQIIPTESVGTVTLGDSDESAHEVDFGNPYAPDVVRRAGVSYNNAVNKLNNKANEYKDNQGIATKARCLGGRPDFKSDTTDMYSGASSGNGSQWDNLFKNGDQNYVEDVEQLKSLGNIINSSDGYIWLASRSVYKRDHLSFYVNVFPITFDGFDNHIIMPSFDINGLCDVCHTWTSSSTFNFYPIFAISNNAIITEGEGTVESPYILGI